MEIIKPVKSANFRLEKLYIDCIDDNGNCFIIYRAKLEFYFLKLYYSALLFSDSLGITTEISSSSKSGSPLITDVLIYYNHFLQIKGSWKRTDSSLPLFTFEDSNNRDLVWNCHHPKAKTEIVYNDNNFSGYGYAETLSLTIKPFNLPMEELRWGRFLSDEFTVIWINWKGSNPLNKIYCNGKEYNDAEIEDDRIVFANSTFNLMFVKISIVRKGKVSDVFSKVPWLKILFRKRSLNTMEVKYKAKSTLSQNAEIAATGWALYETVIWKN